MENNLQTHRIHNYVMGLLSKEEMYELEREALGDPFLQDAIDGYRLQNGVESAPLSLLQKRLSERIQQKSSAKNQHFFNWQRLTIALLAGVMFVVACSLIFFKHLHKRHDHEKTTEVLLMENDARVELQGTELINIEPIQGWSQFQEEINSELSEIPKSADLLISFSVKNGSAKDIMITGTDDRKLKSTVSKFISEKTSWIGSSGEFHLHLQNL